MGEYLASMAMAGVSTTIFLGGYNGPGVGIPYIGPLIGAGWFFAKMLTVIFFIIWVRGTWPRIRVDQLMAFAWKVMLPMSILNIVAAGVSHFMDSKLAAWIGTALFLWVAWLILSRVSVTDRLEKRQYRYVS